MSSAAKQNERSSEQITFKQIAGYGNRTRVSCLGSTHITIVLTPHTAESGQWIIHASPHNLFPTVVEQVYSA